MGPLYYPLQGVHNRLIKEWYHFYCVKDKSSKKQIIVFRSLNDMLHEGRLIRNRNRPINPKVVYLYVFWLLS